MDINIGKNAQTLEISPQFSEYTGVRILTGLKDDDNNDIVYESSNFDENGRILEISNEWGTQAQADNIMAAISGKTYQPYDASYAVADPMANLGDSIEVNGVYSSMCNRIVQFSHLMAEDISAPQDEEIDHEYEYESSSDRTFTRELNETKSELKIQASQIAAKVSSSGGASSSFGWVLTDHDWSLYSGSSQVLSADSSGLTVAGTIRARDFQTLDGKSLATTEELELIRTSNYSGASGSNGYVSALTSALKVGDNVTNGKSAAAALPYVWASRIYSSEYLNVNSSSHSGSSADDCACDVSSANIWKMFYLNGSSYTKEVKWGSISGITGAQGTGGGSARVYDSWIQGYREISWVSGAEGTGGWSATVLRD